MVKFLSTKSLKYSSFSVALYIDGILVDGASSDQSAVNGVDNGKGTSSFVEKKCGTLHLKLNRHKQSISFMSG
jgi:hypothetical protein